MGNPAPDSPSLEIPIQNAIASCKPPFLFPLLTWPQDDQTASKKLDQFHPTIPSASVVIPTPPLISAKDSDEQLDVTNDTLLPTMPSFPTPKCSFCGNCTILGPFSAFAARSVVASRGNVYIAFACAWGDVEAHVSARVDVLEDKSPSRCITIQHFSFPLPTSSFSRAVSSKPCTSTLVPAFLDSGLLNKSVISFAAGDGWLWGV